MRENGSVPSNLCCRITCSFGLTDGPTLTVFNEPSIRTETSVVKWRDERFPNTLIGLTTHSVSRTEVREGDALEIVFDNGQVFIVPLKKRDYTGPEALTFDGRHFWVL